MFKQTLGQQYRSGVFCGPCCARCYAARTKHADIIETVFSAWSVPKIYKRHGKSLGANKFWRSKRMEVQRSITEIRELELDNLV
jgi:hypothetical protein